MGRQRRETKAALHTAIQNLAKASSKAEDATAALMVREATIAFGLLDGALPLPPGEPTYRSRRAFEPRFSETSS
jgi:hypothetical protein